MRGWLGVAAYLKDNYLKQCNGNGLIASALFMTWRQFEPALYLQEWGTISHLERRHFRWRMLRLLQSVYLLLHAYFYPAAECHVAVRCLPTTYTSSKGVSEISKNTIFGEGTYLPTITFSLVKDFCVPYSVGILCLKAHLHLKILFMIIIICESDSKWSHKFFLLLEKSLTPSISTYNSTFLLWPGPDWNIWLCRPAAAWFPHTQPRHRGVCTNGHSARSNNLLGRSYFNWYKTTKAPI